MTWLAIRIGLGLVWSRLRSAGAWVSANPFVAVCCALAVLCLLCWHEWSVKSRQVAQLTAEIARFHEAQSRAAEIAQAALHHQEAAYILKAKEADDAYQIKLVDADLRARTYIAAHRVERLRADGASGAGTAPAGTESLPAESGNRSGAAADMVAVTPSDIEVCTTNTRRLQSVRDWAVSLNQ